MIRHLHYFNLLGVLILVGICSMQWRTNGIVNLRAMNLENIRIQQMEKIAEQEKTISGYTADLEDFRQRLMLAKLELKDSQKKLATVTAERDELTTSRDQWVAAVAARDAALKEGNEKLQKAVKDRNETVVKFNDLAARYNVLSGGK